ncbi:MAG: hypothetical protein JWR16_3004 [Nevskia sp.]|nr:hypothetical protein [Nevskia sp.]
MFMKLVLRQPILCLFAVLGAAAALTGCNSQMDDLGDVVVRQNSVTPGGIYQGTLTAQAGGTAVAVVALVDNLDPQEHFVIYAADGSFLMSGLFTAVGTGLTGQSRYFDLSTATATTTQTFSITGSYVPQSQIGGQYTRMNSSGAAVESGTLSLAYQTAAYETRSALALLEGVWSNVDAFGTPQISFSLDSSGGISGTVAATDCTYNGNVTVVDLRYNVYSIKLTETCGVSGTLPLVLTGLATLLPASTSTANQKQLVLALGSTSAGRLFRLSPGS